MQSMQPRVALFVCVAAAATLAISGGAAGKPARRVGVVYGGHTSQGAPVWLRLRDDRHAITNFDFGWRVSATHCTNGRPMVMPENFDAAFGFAPIKLHDGRFSGTIPERVGTPDGSGSERFTLSVTVTDATVRATFSARVHVNVDAGGTYDCTLGRASLTAVN
jgi:hypothetical protein